MGSPIWVKLSEGVQEGTTVVRQQLSQHPPVGARGKVLSVPGVAAVDGCQADVEISQQHDGPACLTQRCNAHQQRLRMCWQLSAKPEPSR